MADVDILAAGGIQNAQAVVDAATATGVPLAIAVAFVQHETGGKNIYGHDPGGAMSAPGDNPVTQANYAQFLELVRAGHTSNGVGPLQLTYPDYFKPVTAEVAALWQPLPNLVFGLKVIRDYLGGNYTDANLNRAAQFYNSGRADGAPDYGKAIVANRAKWAALLNPKGNTMSVTANGWPLKSSGFATFTAPNGHVTSVASHDLAVIFAYLAYRWDTEIEKVTACYGNRTPAQQQAVNPGVMDSNHISATAIDVNGAKHPYEHTTRNWSSGFSTAGLAKLREILAATGVLQTGLDFTHGYRDAMHVQVKESLTNRYSRPVSAAAVAASAKKLSAWAKGVQKAVGVTQDGVPGPATKAAVGAFQKKHGLVVDYVWGPKSQAAAGGKTPVKKPVAPKPVNTKHTDTGQDLNAWLSVADVKKLQHILKVKPEDGVAGKVTVNALEKKAGYKAGGRLDPKGSNTIRKVQARCNQQIKSKLAVDGRLGKATGAALHTYLAKGGVFTNLSTQKI